MVLATAFVTVLEMLLELKIHFIVRMVEKWVGVVQMQRGMNARKTLL